MRNQSLILLAGLLIVAVAVLVGPSLFESSEPPVLRWDEGDEVVVETDDGSADDPMSVGLQGTESPERQELQPTELAPEERTELTLRGRIVDSYKNPVPAARVWLGFARGGPQRGGSQRQIDDAVLTDADGRFAFAGATFRNLRINLTVAHDRFAPARFDQNLGEVQQQEVDLGEFALLAGAEFVGRVTDAYGNSIVGATISLQPQGRQSFAFRRRMDEVLPATNTDNNGYYAFGHVPDGEWRVQAAAPRHQRGNSASHRAPEGMRVEIEDLELGPGFDLAGIVSDATGKPVAEASVTLRKAGDDSPTPPRPGRNLFGNGNANRTETDADGRFHFDHLAGGLHDLTASKKGFLLTTTDGIDPSSGQQVFITLLDGLRIQGVVTDRTTGAPVTRFELNVERLRNLDAEASPWNRFRRNRMPRAQGLAPDDYPGGAFVEDGLEQGIYQVRVESPDHARHTTDEFELRLGAPTPNLQIRLDAGHAIAGTVRDATGLAIADAQVDVLEVRNDDDTVPGFGNRNTRGIFANMRGPRTSLYSTKTDTEGRFEFPHVASGRYQLAATKDGFDRDELDEFQLAADLQNVELTLGALGSVAGRVLGPLPKN